MEKDICTVCGSEEMKTGKLMGIASLQSLSSRSGLGGSELNLTFCAKCGEVRSIKVVEPDKID